MVVVSLSSPQYGINFASPHLVIFAVDQTEDNGVHGLLLMGTGPNIAIAIVRLLRSILIPCEDCTSIMRVGASKSLFLFPHRFKLISMPT